MADLEEIRQDDTEDLEAVYDHMFSYRYTDDDVDYKRTVSSPLAECPCVAGYSTRPGRDFDQNRGGRGGHRGHWRGRGDWTGHQRSPDGGGRNYGQDNGRDRQHSYTHDGSGGRGYNQDNGRDRRHSSGRDGGGQRYRPY